MYWLLRPRRRRAEVYGSILDKWGTQMLRVVLQGGDEPVLASVVTELGRGIAEAVVVPGIETIGEFMGSDIFDHDDRNPLRNVRRAGCGGAGVRDAGVAAACDERGGLAVGTGPGRRDRRSSLAGARGVGRGSAAWPDNYRVVKGWSGGTAIL